MIEQYRYKNKANISQPQQKHDQFSARKIIGQSETDQPQSTGYTGKAEQDIDPGPDIFDQDKRTQEKQTTAYDQVRYGVKSHVTSNNCSFELEVLTYKLRFNYHNSKLKIQNL